MITSIPIYCDDDAYKFLLLGNIIENTPNDHSISARFAGAERQTFYPKKSYNKKVFYNVVDIRYTSREDNVYVDDTGFFTEDGRIDSAYNIKEWNINIKNRRHERK